MLIDVLRAPLRLRYRLIGTKVVAATGEDRTGKFFDSVDFLALNPVVMQEYLTVAETGEPHYSLEPFYRCDNGNPYDVERLMLPLSSDSTAVDMILVYFRFTSGPYANR